VKLGTITPEGGGGEFRSHGVGGRERELTLRLVGVDIYCYSCDDSKVDMDLPNHLKHFGLDIVSQQKTDKSMTELVSIR
jgi:ubiquitin carboxyl-terminal hydrolase 5/13